MTCEQSQNDPPKKRKERKFLKELWRYKQLCVMLFLAGFGPISETGYFVTSLYKPGSRPGGWEQFAISCVMGAVIGGLVYLYYPPIPPKPENGKG